jgi:hypothetical protein
MIDGDSFCFFYWGWTRISLVALSISYSTLLGSLSFWRIPWLLRGVLKPRLKSYQGWSRHRRRHYHDHQVIACVICRPRSLPPSHPLTLQQLQRSWRVDGRVLERYWPSDLLGGETVSLQATGRVLSMESSPFTDLADKVWIAQRSQTDSSC